MHHTILITGMTSGFGSVCTERSAREGWRLIPTGRRAERLQEHADSFGRVSIHSASLDTKTVNLIPASQRCGPFLVPRQRD